MNRPPSHRTLFVRYRAIVVLLAIVLTIIGLAHAPPSFDTATPAAAAPPLAQPLVIDFDTLSDIPTILQQPITDALVRDTALLPDTNRFTVSAARLTKQWGYITLVPTAVVEDGWQAVSEADVVEVLTFLPYEGDAQAVVFGGTGYDELARQAPPDFMPGSSGLDSGNASSLQLKFPWTNGQPWYKTQGWHGSYTSAPTSDAMDFQPVQRSNPSSHYAVLAADGGRLEKFCSDNSDQAWLRMVHNNGQTTIYGHLRWSTVRQDLIGKTIPQGQYLGQLFINGSIDNGYNTPCGYGTGGHLHFVFPERDVRVEGRWANDVANSASSAQYTSTNARIDNGTQPNPTNPNEVIVDSRNASYSPGLGATCNTGWYEWGYGRGGHGIITLSAVNSAASTNAVVWRPNLPKSGRWKVEVHIPNHPAFDWPCGSYNPVWDTERAKYEVRHTGGTTTRTVNQKPLANAWVDLGTYTFNAGTNGYIRLSDLTGESTGSHYVSIDDARFTLVEDANQPPRAPTLLAPANNATITGNSITLSWKDNGDPDNKPRDYRNYAVELYRNGTRVAESGWITNTTWTYNSLQPGVYTWKVKAGDGDASSTFTATWGFTVQSPITPTTPVPAPTTPVPAPTTPVPAPLAIHGVVPSSGVVGVENTLIVHGTGFKPGATITLGGTKLTTTYNSSSSLMAVVPVTMLPGNHTVSIRNPDGSTVQQSNAYSLVVATLNDDLYVQMNDLFTVPHTLRVGEPMKVGVAVLRRGGKQTLSNVKVAFFSEANDGTRTALGTTTIPLLSVRTPRPEAVALDLTSPLPAGAVTLVAVIDPDNVIPEDNEQNNEIRFSTTVLPASSAGGDQTAPRVDNLTLDDSTSTTTDRDIVIDVTASDPNTPTVASGISSIYFVEYYLLQEVNRWVPVQTSGEPIPYDTARNDYPWQLVDMSGMHYIQAWAYDKAGNVSLFPNMQQISYVPPTDRVSFDKTVVTRQELEVGDTLTVTLSPTAGDPDLFVWTPRTDDGVPPYVSNLSNGDDVVQFTVTSPEDAGTYQIEVYGNSIVTAEYTQSVTVTRNNVASVSANNTDPTKTIPDSPTVPLDSIPGSDIGLPPAPVQLAAEGRVYLPMVVK